MDRRLAVWIRGLVRRQEAHVGYVSGATIAVTDGKPIT